MQQLMFKSLSYYFPFLNMDVVYDDRRLRHELGDACPHLRDVEEYLPELADIISSKSAIMEAALP